MKMGMLGGIATLGVIGLVAQEVVEFGSDVIFVAVVKELYKKGECKESILMKINRYSVSKSLKRKLRKELDKIS